MNVSFLEELPEDKKKNRETGKNQKTIGFSVVKALIWRSRHSPQNINTKGSACFNPPAIILHLVTRSCNRDLVDDLFQK
jgi:hypothetical protein